MLVALGAALENVAMQAGKSERISKTAWFAKAARKAYIPDEELCSGNPASELGVLSDSRGEPILQA